MAQGVGIVPISTQTFYAANLSTQIPPMINGQLSVEYMAIEDVKNSLPFIMQVAGRDTAVWNVDSIRIDTLDRTRINPLVTAKSGVGGAGVATTVTIAAADLGPGAKTNLQVNDLVYVRTAAGVSIQCKVTAIPADNQATIIPTDSTLDVYAAITVNVTRLLYVHQNVWGEATNQPRYGFTGITSQSYKLQIIKGGLEESGTFIPTSPTWYNKSGAVTTTPGTGVFWSSFEAEDAYRKFQTNRAMNLLNANPVATNTGDRMMTGLFYVCNNSGINLSIVGGFANFSTSYATQYLKAQLGTNTGVRSFVGFSSTYTSMDISEALRNQMASGNAYSGMFGNMNMNTMIGFGFTGINITGDMSLGWKALPEFDNQSGLGYHYQNTMFVTPEGMADTYGGRAPFWETLYLSANGVNRREDSWTRGGAVLGQTQLETDVFQMFWRGEIGACYRQKQNFGFMKG